jgi:hypothetical protein
MIFRTMATAGLASCLALVAGYAAAKKPIVRHSAPPGAVGSAGPYMYEARPGLWISSWDCIMDEGQGRWIPCSAGGGRRR